MTFKLLANLIDDLASLVIAMENSGKSLVLDTVIEKLFQEEIKRNESSRKQHSAFRRQIQITSFQEVNQLDPEDSNGKLRTHCFNCGKPDYIPNVQK